MYDIPDWSHATEKLLLPIQLLRILQHDYTLADRAAVSSDEFITPQPPPGPRNCPATKHCPEHTELPFYYLHTFTSPNGKQLRHCYDRVLWRQTQARSRRRRRERKH